jgi:hypothetical protein
MPRASPYSLPKNLVLSRGETSVSLEEVAVEHAIEQVCAKVKAEIAASGKHPEAVAALKRVGGHALTLFDRSIFWSVPDWTKAYAKIFKEQK